MLPTDGTDVCMILRSCGSSYMKLDQRKEQSEFTLFSLLRSTLCVKQRCRREGPPSQPNPTPPHPVLRWLSGCCCCWTSRRFFLGYKWSPCQRPLGKDVWKKIVKTFILWRLIKHHDVLYVFRSHQGFVAEDTVVTAKSPNLRHLNVTWPRKAI